MNNLNMFQYQNNSLITVVINLK